MLLQNCDGRFQIGSADQACREHGRCLFVVVRERRMSAFAGEFAALVAPLYRK
jgi:hypothetical protein